MKWLKPLLLIIPGVYLSVVTYFYFYQDKLLFLPDNSKLENCIEAKQLGFQTVETHYEDQDIRYLLKINPAARADIIVFHGNTSTACKNIVVYLEMNGLNLNFILATYPGYEGDRHEPGEKIFLKNGEALLDYVKLQSYGKLPIALFGRSLGTGEATYLASVRPVAGLILQSPYTSISEIAAFKYPFLPVSLINRNVFPSSLWALNVSCPVLLLHGTNDQTIPIKYGQKLASLFRSQVKVVAIEGAGHDDMTTVQDGIFWKEIRAFLLRLEPMK